VLVVLVSITPFLGLEPVQGVNAKADVPALIPMSLTVVGASGSQVVLNETGIAGLLSYTGYGGFKNRLGNLKGFGDYTGVSLNTLCSLVGGLNATDSLNVTVSDGYFQIFTYEQINGDFITYNNITGDQVSHRQPLVPIVAYYFNGANLSSDVGPLRLAIVGTEGLCTDSTYWVKWVVRIVVMKEDVPEFPSLMVFPLFLLATLVAVLSLRARRRYRIRLCNSKRLTEGRVSNE
jgi:hypothetical protein